MEKPWKERIILRRKAELEKRGVEVSKNARENKDKLKEAGERGGTVTPKVVEERVVG